MAGFFDNIVSEKVRTEFVQHKSAHRSEESREKLSGYILSDACVSDLVGLSTGTYRFRAPERVVRTDLNGKKRSVYRYPEHDRMLLSLIAYYLHIYDARFGPDLYSHRLDTGVQDVLTRIRTQPGIHRMTAYKTDIRSYGESIGRERLKEKLDAFLPDDPELCLFLKSFIDDDRYTENGSNKNGAPAVRQGCPLTGFLENVFLIDADRAIAGKADVYCRYNDDILFYSESTEVLAECRELLGEILSGLGLTEKADKAVTVAPGEFVQFICFNLAGSRQDFCGNQVYIWEQSVKELTREMLYLKRRLHLSDDFAMLLTIKNFEPVRNRYLKMMMYLTESRTLKIMDHIFLDAIRTVGNSGPGRRKYKISYETIKALGYSSLVSEYYALRGK